MVEKPKENRSSKYLFFAEMGASSGRLSYLSNTSVNQQREATESFRFATDATVGFDEQFINENYYSNQFDIGLMLGLSSRYSISEKNFLGLNIRMEEEYIFGWVNASDFGSNYRLFGGSLGWYRRF